jgi:hypothetical protein
VTRTFSTRAALAAQLREQFRRGGRSLDDRDPRHVDERREHVDDGGGCRRAGGTVSWNAAPASAP